MSNHHTPQFPDLKNTVVLITGGAQGIGEAMVHAFAEQGARVFFCDVDSEKGGELAEKVPNTRFSRVDLREEAEIVSWISESANETGEIRVLLNNAACDPRIPLAELSAEVWDDLMATNLRPHMLTTREASPYMKAGASIINFSSITFHLGPTEMSAYVATKGAILAMTRSLARELGPSGIRVNTISPGWIMTERQKREFVTPEIEEMILREQCLPELIQPAEIANVALFLASDVSSALTGQELLADRGWRHS